MTIACDNNSIRREREKTMALDRINQLLQMDDRLFERVTHTDHIWGGQIFQVDQLEVELSDGSSSKRDILHHHGGAGVCVIRDNKICLVKQYRVALGRMTLEIPAGKLDPNEDPAVCAARELTEETGLVATELVHIATTAGAPGFNDEKTRVFAARGCYQSEATPDEGEFVDVVWVDLDEMVEAIQAGIIEDAKTVVSVLCAKAGLV